MEIFISSALHTLVRVSYASRIMPLRFMWSSLHRFFDIGAARKFELARKMFYTGLSGIVMVFDVTNRNSYDHLRHWIHELRWTDAVRPVESTSVWARIVCVCVCVFVCLRMRV